MQYSIKGDEYRFETPLNTLDMTYALNLEQIVGRFTLYPTSNTYTFIMVDQIDGHTFQVQWNGEKEHRFVIPISE